MRARADWAAAAFLAAALLGCQSTPKSAAVAKQSGPPEVSTEGITTVAFLEMANVTDDDHAGARMADLLESHIKAEGGYNLLGMYETATHAARDANARADLERLRKDWRQTRHLDPAILIRFGRAIGAEGVVAAELLAWTSHKVDWNVEGKSYTRVTCKLSFYDARTGLSVWTKTEDTMVESANYDPSTTGLGDQSGVPSTELVNRAPEPPPIDQVAERAAERLSRALPKPKTSS